MAPTTVRCQICQKTVSSYKGLGVHLKNQHPSQAGEAYYLRYLTNGLEVGTCAHCLTTPTVYINLVKGYHRFCSVRCARTSPEVIARREETNLRRHGVTYYTKSPRFQEQAKGTRQDRYGDPNYNNLALQQETMLARHGKVHNWSGESGTRSCDLTKLERYGSLTYSNQEQGKATRLRLYGDEHFNRAACRATNLERYGVEWPLQNATILAKNRKYRSYPYTMPSGNTVQVQGYERYALDWVLQRYDESDLRVTKGDVPRFNYVLDGRPHYYFPDIYVVSTKLVVEVKSNYTLQLHPKTVRAKMLAVLQAGFKHMIIVVSIVKNAPSYHIYEMNGEYDLTRLEPTWGKGT